MFTFFRKKNFISIIRVNETIKKYIRSNKNINPLLKGLIKEYKDIRSRTITIKEKIHNPFYINIRFILSIKRCISNECKNIMFSKNDIDKFNGLIYLKSIEINDLNKDIEIAKYNLSNIIKKLKNIGML